MKKSSAKAPGFESKYARKLRLRSEISKPSTESNEVIVVKSAEQAVSKVRQVEESTEEILEATVTAHFLGSFFLKDDGGAVIHMGLRKVQKSPFNGKIKNKTRIRCKIVVDPNGKGPRVAEILEIVCSEAVAS